MSLIDKLRNYFRPAPAPSTLRNKPGGMAWICMQGGGGSETLHGHIVTTVRLDRQGFWIVEPRQVFVPTCQLLDAVGRLVVPGVPCEVTGFGDSDLEPIKPVADDERSQELAWLPPVPTGAKVAA